jgi:AraC-like DNA-binding protein
MYVNTRLFSMQDWEAHFAHAHYQCAALAGELGLSRRTLRRHITTAFHHAPHRWLEAIRLLKAAELLRTNLSVKEVAAQLDYKQLSHFSAAFKRFYGICPSQYRLGNAHQRALWAQDAAQRRAL